MDAVSYTHLQIHPRKLINTREELEMMRNGLLEMFNIPINDQNEMMKFKNNRRNLIDMHNPISTIASTMETALTYSLYKQNNEMIEIGMETSENSMIETFKYKMVTRKWTRKEVILKTTAILTTGVTHIIMDLSLIHISKNRKTSDKLCTSK